MDQLLLALHQRYSTPEFSLLRHLYRHHPRSTLLVFRRLDDLSRHIIRTLLGQRFTHSPDDGGMQPLGLELSRFVRLGLQGFASDSLEALTRFDIMSKASTNSQAAVCVYLPFLEGLDKILSSHVDEPMLDAGWRPPGASLTSRLVQRGSGGPQRTAPGDLPADQSAESRPEPRPEPLPEVASAFTDFSITSYVYDAMVTVESTPMIVPRTTASGIDVNAAVVAREAVREQAERAAKAALAARGDPSVKLEKPASSVSEVSGALGALDTSTLTSSSGALAPVASFTPPPRGNFAPESLKASVELVKRFSDINSQSSSFGWNRMLNALVEPPSGLRREVDHKMEETYELLIIFGIIEAGQLPRTLEERLQPGVHSAARLTDKGNDFLLAETHDQVLEIFRSFAELFLQNWHLEYHRRTRKGGWPAGQGAGARNHARAQIVELHRLTTYLRGTRDERDPPPPLEEYLTEAYPLDLLGCMCDLCTLSTDVLYAVDKAYIRKHLIFLHWLIHLGLLMRWRGDGLPYGRIAISNVVMFIGGVRNAFTPLGEMRHRSHYGYVFPAPVTPESLLQGGRRGGVGGAGGTGVAGAGAGAVTGMGGPETLGGPADGDKDGRRLPAGVSQRDLAGLASSISLITESTGRIYMYKSKNAQQNEVNGRILGMFARRVYDLPHMSCYQIRQELYKDAVLMPQEGALGGAQAEQAMLTFQFRQMLQFFQDQQRAAQRARAKPVQLHPRGPKCQLSAKRIGKYLVDKSLRLTRPEDTASLRRPHRDAFGAMAGADGADWDEGSLPVPVTLLNKLMLEEYTSQNAVVLEGVRCIVFTRPAEVIRAEQRRLRDARGYSSSYSQSAAADALADPSQRPVTNLPEDFVYPEDTFKMEYQHTVAQYAAYFITVRLAELSRNLVWFDKEVYARYSHRHTEMSKSRLYRGNFASFNDLSLREIRAVEEIWRDLDGMYAAAEARGDKKLRVLIKEAGSDEFLRRVLAELRRISEPFHLAI